MTEYLEKSAVIKAIHDEIYDGGKWNGGWYEHSEEQAEKNFTERINAIIPITKEHGEWKLANDDDYWLEYRCTKCHESIVIGNSKMMAKVMYIKPRPTYNFCPHCGADMRR